MNSCSSRSSSYQHAERAGDVRHSQADLTKARDLLAYRPVVEFRDGLKETVEWYRHVLA